MSFNKHFIKKILLSLLVLIPFFSKAQNNNISGNLAVFNEIVVRNYFRPGLDTVVWPKNVGEFRIRLQDTAIYIAISTTSPRKWVRYSDNQLPLNFNFGLQAATYNGASRISLAARSVINPLEESLFYLDSNYAGIFGRNYVDIRGRSTNPRVPIRLGALANSANLDSVLRMNIAGELQQVALNQFPKDTLLLKKGLDSLYLAIYGYDGRRDSLGQIHLKDLVYRERYKWDIFEEFIASGFGGNFTATSANSGGAFVVATTVTGRLGEAQVQTATSANGRGAIASAETIQLNSSQYTFELDGGVLNSLNNASDSIYLYIGFFDNAGTDNTPVDGAYFRYDAGATAWQICTRSNSVETRQTTASTIVTNTEQRFTVVASTTGVSFFINGTQVGTTITTNIPSGVGRDVSMGVKIMKRGGTGFRSFNFDKLKFKIGD